MRAKTRRSDPRSTAYGRRAIYTCGVCVSIYESMYPNHYKL